MNCHLMAFGHSGRLAILLTIFFVPGASGHRTFVGKPSRFGTAREPAPQDVSFLAADENQRMHLSIAGAALTDKQDVKLHEKGAEVAEGKQKDIRIPNVGGLQMPDDRGGADDWRVMQPDPLDNEKLSLKDILMNIGGGTGASVSGTGDTLMDQDLLRRMRYQDKAVMMLLLLAYTGSLLFSASFAYRQARNDSPVKFYADPRFHNATSDSEDMESFMETFNQPPGDAQLQVTGLVPLPPLPDYVVDTAVHWFGARYRVAFSFALDLSPWLVPNGGYSASNADEGGRTEGVPAEDVETLRNFLENDANPLSFVEMQKEVEWKDWEELATNIKSQIRQGGFNGHIHVRRNCEEVVAVHKNTLWANFMHSRTTKVLLALSVVGWFVYQPYMWLRHYAINVRCKYRVDIDIGQFWPLIAHKIGPDGFDSGVGGQLRPNLLPSSRNSMQQQW